MRYLCMYVHEIHTHTSKGTAFCNAPCPLSVHVHYTTGNWVKYVQYVVEWTMYSVI